MKPPRCIAGLALALALSARAADPAVDVSLRFPEAETWVLGDDIPLFWHFENRSAVPLAFMWEACCRQNGRMTVTSNGVPIDTVPPVTAVAHMFARAETLPPGEVREFETKLSDWAVLPGTGRYTLAGTYTGVTTNQQPVVPRNLPVWRGTTATPPVEVALLGVEDYLRQRGPRAARRGLELKLAGPSALTPLGTNTWRLEVRNRAAEPRTLVWPDQFQPWVIDAAGRRLARGAVFDAPQETFDLAPGATWSREFSLAADRFEREPLGDHRLFVDLASASAGEPRVPSNVLPLAWQLPPAAVADLLNLAAQGTAAGGRNPALRLLRQYLAELAPTLAALDGAGLDAPARPLLKRLRQAARLKPVSPRPGLAVLDVRFDEAGRAAWVDVRLATNLPALDPPRGEAFAPLVALRRDLGWSLEIRLLPAPGTRLADLARFATAVPEAEAGSGPFAAVAFLDGGTNTSARVQFTAMPEVLVARSLKNESGRVGPGEATASGAALVEAPGALTWADLTRSLAAAESPAGFALRVTPAPTRAAN
ncbi:MAG: hypothetical protein ACKVYV_17750 [Limisphaerales bacterium]